MSALGTAPVLCLNKLTKHYGSVAAVNELSFEVHPGDIFGFLGPNGAGKSTTMGMIAGLVRPSAGSINLFGHTGRSLAARRQIGALIEVPAFYTHLSARRNLRLLASLQAGIPKTRVEEVLEIVGLRDRARDRVSAYSHGMKQRLGIAQALLNNPKLLLLDEPTNGLDPEGSIQVWDLLRRLAREQNMTVFVSSHLLHEVEDECNRIAVINKGILVACDAVKNLLFFARENVQFHFDTAADRELAARVLGDTEGVELIDPPPVPPVSIIDAPARTSQSDAPSSDTPRDAATGAFGSSPALPAITRAPGTSVEDHIILARVAAGVTSRVVARLAVQGVAPRAIIPLRKTLKQFFLELTRRQG